jgi:hypothetical protein
MVELFAADLIISILSERLNGIQEVKIELILIETPEKGVKMKEL